MGSLKKSDKMVDYKEIERRLERLEKISKEIWAILEKKENDKNE